MIINYDVDKINNALQDFYNAIGIRINFLKDDFTPINQFQQSHIDYCKAIQATSSGQKACNCSDIFLLEKCKKSKKPESHICHAGLMDIAVPILYDDSIIGYIIFGEIKIDKLFSDLKEYISGLGLDAKKMEIYYSKLSAFDSKKIQSISNIASMLVKNLLLENMLKPDLDDSLSHAVDFINNNLENDLSIKNISNSINVSKSVIYKKFHNRFGCTVSEYIKNKRIEKSITLLEKSNLSIEEVSQKSGFSSASYYSKVFKAKMGISPLNYKKNFNH